MQKKLEIKYNYTATDDFTNPQKPRFIYSLPLHHDTFVAVDCSYLPRFEK
tara:strand:+ start:140 stop:289 length:150 start_codon:yes stop_codon:yes gene_type:complete